METQIAFAVVTLMSVLPATGGLLFNPAVCPAPTDCSCGSVTIECESRGLTTIPQFSDTGAWVMGPLSIDLSNNSISRIPNHAYINLTDYIHGNELSLYLQGNNLTDPSIAEHAFSGIANMLVTIVADDNHLTTIPKAFTKLRNLARLSMMNNPISIIDPLSMLSIGRTLRGLNISMPGLQSWPDAFQYLRTLADLRVKDYPHDVPYDAFNGFRYTLQELVLSNTTVGSLPTAVCRLPYLRRLTIAGDRNYTGGSLAHCMPALASITTLNFISNALDTFPNVFRTFPNVSILRIQNSDIQFVDDTAIPPFSGITTLEISHSKLTSFPGAVNAFSYIWSCDLHSNQIHTIESYSIGYLPNLIRLNLNNNPLQFISNVAFEKVLALRDIYLKGTQLASIPQAVMPLVQLVTLDLRPDHVNCDCDSHWIKYWSQLRHVTVAGNCKLSTETIADFLNNTLPLCP